MAKIVRPVLVGGVWGLGLGAVAALAAVLGPGLRPLAQRVVAGYAAAAHEASERATEARARLQTMYEGGRDTG